jgi:hypothetical protein
MTASAPVPNAAPTPASTPRPAQPLIESDHEFFSKSGPVPSAMDDIRQFPRYFFRFCFTAKIQPGRKGGQEREQILLTRDLSRGGLSIVHTEQLFPGQKLVIELNDAPRTVEVRWCRKAGPQRYLAGCRFVKD